MTQEATADRGHWPVRDRTRKVRLVRGNGRDWLVTYDEQGVVSLSPAPAER